MLPSKCVFVQRTGPRLPQEVKLYGPQDKMKQVAELGFEDTALAQRPSYCFQFWPLICVDFLPGASLIP